MLYTADEYPKYKIYDKRTNLVINRVTEADPREGWFKLLREYAYKKLVDGKIVREIYLTVKDVPFYITDEENNIVAESHKYPGYNIWEPNKSMEDDK